MPLFKTVEEFFLIPAHAKHGFTANERYKKMAKERGEQPIDVAYTVMALAKFHYVFNKEEYKQKIKVAFNWFLGENHLHQIVYNPCTGGCYDGVEEYNVNLNQGAESTLSYLMARLTLEQWAVFEKRLRQPLTDRANSRSAAFTQESKRQGALQVQ